jgi:hypothetical protein
LIIKEKAKGSQEKKGKAPRKEGTAELQVQ